MFILSGRAKVSMSISNGKQLLLDYFVTDGVIGDLELFMGKSTVASTMQAITELKCIGLPLDKYALRLKSDVVFLNWAGRELAFKMFKSDINGAETILKRLEPRLCLYIYNSSHNGIFRETMTDVAEMLGTSYRHLLRTLKKLCSENLISKQKTGYIIINEEELKKRAFEL
ncbi:Regulatory protein YeiL [bioreactor metagenome]|uniref:Regulatory protein YeiL n=1 Tax=bioreactor metagenome TaxID=1076179 RepID=A0A645FS93_9ZZZZ